MRSISSSQINIVRKWVEVDIELEYCVTKTTVDYLNENNENGEISFDITIPEGAFITALDMYVCFVQASIKFHLFIK